MKLIGGKILDHIIEISLGAALIILSVLSSSYFDNFVKKDVFADYKLSESRIDTELKTDLRTIKEDVKFIKTFIYEHLKEHK